jgi:Ca-activated chloride channel homolog
MAGGVAEVKKLMIVSLCCVCSSALAMEWKDLWLREDQQEIKILKTGNYFYKTKQFSNAIEYYSHSDQAIAHYNKGNALAQLNRYEEAIEAYDHALEKNPKDMDALYNRELVKNLLKNKNSSSSDSKDSENSKDDKDSSEHQDSETENNSSPKKNSISEKKPQSSPSKSTSQDSTEKSQQWLASIPDDPGGLLRMKFMRDHERSQAALRISK